MSARLTPPADAVTVNVPPPPAGATELIEKLAMPAGIVTDAGKPPGPGGGVGVTVRLTGMSVAAGAVRVNISVRT